MMNVKFQKALFLLDKKEYDKAETLIKKALEESENEYECMQITCCYAEVLIELKRYDEAYEKARYILDNTDEYSACDKERETAQSIIDEIDWERKMEIMDLYDKDRQPLNETAVRGIKLPKGKYRIVVHICVFNDRNEMLIQQRQSTKKIFPDMWDITAGGQVSAGETSAESAERELFEEMGIHIDMSDMRPSFTMNFDDGFDDVYLIRENINVDTLKLQDEEVQAAKWATQEEILEMIKDGVFINYHKSYIDLLFTMVDENGTFSEG